MTPLALHESGHRQPHADDLWSPLNYAIGAGVGPTARGSGIARWIPDDDSRRLVAYQFLSEVARNLRRYWLPPSMWQTPPAAVTDERTLVDAGPVAVPAANYREYGDAGNIVDVARSLVLGDEQRFRVPDAEPGPRPPDGGPPPEPAGFPRAVQDWLDEWTEKEQLTELLHEVEDNAITMGDAVLALVWSPRKGRPVVRSYDPGFYFPDWDAASSKQYRDWGWEDEGFPPVVHLAWQIDDPDDPERQWIERSTWRLVKLPRPAAVKYQPERVEWTCVFEKTWFDLETDGSVYTWRADSRKARRVTEPTDLGIDFLPVVHVPNTPPGSKLWGRSLLMTVTQILDDINASDTDLAINAETVAGGTIISKGATEAPPGGAGWWSFMSDGGAQMLDTSRVLDALLKQAERLGKKLALNSRLGEILLGLVAANEVPSGYAMRLGFSGPAALERELTGVRSRRYALLGKMAARMAQTQGVLAAGTTPTVLFVLGKGLPVDRAATIAEVRDLLAPPAAVSTLTTVRMLMDAGVPIEDAEEEVARIRAEQFDNAIKLVEATGDVREARILLGLDPDGGPDTATAAGLPATDLQGGAGEQPADGAGDGTGTQVLSGTVPGTRVLPVRASPGSGNGANGG